MERMFRMIRSLLPVVLLFVGLVTVGHAQPNIRQIRWRTNG